MRGGTEMRRVVPPLVVAAWFVAVVTLTRDGFFRSWGGIGPVGAIQVAIFLPPTVIVGAALWVGPVRRWVADLDLLFLAALQIIRVLGAAHLVYWGAGIMSGSFALPVGIGNLLVTAMAVTAVMRLGRGRPDGRAWLRGVTYLGIAEFLMTIALAMFGFFAQPTTFDPPVSPAGYMGFRVLPLSIFPTFLIPLFLTLHGLTLLRLREQGPDEGASA